MSRLLRYCFFLLLGYPSFGQQQAITGKVLDESGTPLEAATVLETGTKNATSTKADGSFSLVPGKFPARVTISYVGYLKQELEWSGGSSVTISLQPSVANMNDVVVIGYGTAKRRDLTGAVASVAAKDFNKGIITSPDQLIQGKVSGVQISSNNGTPGGAANIKVRGNSAMVGLGQPLFVLDGIPLDGRSVRGGDYSDPNNNNGDGLQLQGGVNPLTFINPDDIASIEVLKDASATAIFGSRAAYGVVMITTKKGQAGEPRLTLGVSTGFSQIMKRIKVLTADQYRDAIPYYNANPNQDRGASVNALDSVLQTGFQQNYSLAISGGGDKGKYRISGNYLDQDGILKQSSLKKYGINLGSSFAFLPDKRLGLDINLNANQYVQDGFSPKDGSSGVVTFALVWNPTDSLNKSGGNPNLNPVKVNQYYHTNLKVSTVLATLSPSFKITRWLEYKLALSMFYSSGINRVMANDLVFNSDPKGMASISNTDQSTKQITHTITFRKDISKGLNMVALAGYEYVSYDMKGDYTKVTGTPGVGLGNYGLNYTNYIQFSNTSNRVVSSFQNPTNETQSFFARASLNYKEKYFFTGTFRADGSTKFGDNHKYGYFPSFAAAWQISNESFFHSDFVNSLKIRAGWGRTGNQDFPSGASQAKYSFYSNGTLSQVNNPNPNLKWQTDEQYNIGVDFSFLKGRLSGTMDYFSKITTDLLFPAPPIQPAPPLSTVRWINLPGKIHNNGLELLINSSIISNQNWSLDISVNASFLHNNVSNMPSTIQTGWLQGSGVSGTNVEVISNGLPMNAFFTRKFLGMDKNSGFSIYQDDGNTFYHVGDPNPKTLAGFTSHLRYMNFTLDINMYGSFGQDIYYNTLMNVINVGKMNSGGNIGLSIYQDPVKESPANPVTPSSRFVLKGNYFKLSNATISYQLGKLGKWMRDARIYLTGQNLFSITKYPGFDPESNFDINNYSIPSLGIDYAMYPTPRTILIGVNFSL